jgi:hypothetical protein
MASAISTATDRSLPYWLALLSGFMLAEYRIVEVLGQRGDPRVFQVQRFALMLGPTHVSLNTIIPNFSPPITGSNGKIMLIRRFLGVFFSISFATDEQVPVQDGGA